MHANRFLLLLCVPILFLPACKKAATTGASSQKQPAPQSKIDACALLTKKEIEAVQGSTVQDAKNSERAEGGLRVSQCYYSSAEPNKSVSLALTQSDADSKEGRTARDFWNEIFGRLAGETNEREGAKEKKENANERERDRGREEEKKPTAKKIEGIGEDAYWSGNRFGGALYVLKGDAFVRISVGGGDSEEGKIEKSKKLALKALDRF